MTQETQHNTLLVLEEVNDKDRLTYCNSVKVTDKQNIPVYWVSACLCLLTGVTWGLSGSIQRHSQAAERDYGTTSCGCTLPGGFCVEQRSMQYFFIITALLEIQCLRNNGFLYLFLSFLSFGCASFLKSSEAISTVYYVMQIGAITLASML